MLEAINSLMKDSWPKIPANSNHSIAPDKTPCLPGTNGTAKTTSEQQPAPLSQNN